MKTDAADSKGSGHAPPHAPPAPSPLRLTVLLSVLVVVGGALVYDWVIAPPRVKAANDKLHAEVLQFNETGLKPDTKSAGVKAGSEAAAKSDGMLYSQDIQQIIGMAPTKVETTELYTIEHYCWWGWIPRNRNYITVLYIGDPKKPHYSTHYANMMPEDGVVPGRRRSEPSVEPASETNNATVATAAGAPAAGRPGMAPGMMGPGMGRGMGPGMGAPGAGGGKGKGRPQGIADKKGSEPKEADEGATKTEGPTKNESAKTEEPKKETAGEGDKKEPAKEAAKESK